MKNLPWNHTCFLSIVSLFATWGVRWTVGRLGSPLAYTNSILALFVFAAWLCALRRLTRGKDWGRTQALLNPCTIFMFCFAGCMIAGAQLEMSGNVALFDWRLYVAAVFMAVASAPILAAVLRKLEEYALTAGASVSRRPPSGNAYRWRIFVILFLSYIPTLLAAFPGFFTYDAEAEAYMVFTEKYSTYQPLLHVLLLGWTLRVIYFITRSYNAAILVYMLVQILVLSACFAYEISFLRQCGVRRWICSLGVLFLTLFPTVSMFVCCSTKDTLFSGGVVLLTTLLLELARDPDAFWSLRQKKILLSCAMLFLLFFRNNGIYALVVFLFFFAILHRRSWKKWFPTVAVTFLIYFVVFQVLVLAFHATKGPLAEMFCVPIQQLARVYVQAGDTLPAEDREVLFTLIPQIILEQYNPKLADTVKINFLEDNFRAAPMKYVSLWFRTGLKHFDIYVNAFLENTYGYWYPDTVLDGYRGIWTAGRQYGDSSYFAFSTDHPGRRMSLLPALEKFYEKISLEIYQQKIPVLSMLFSVGFWHWVYLCTAFYLLATGYKGQAFSLAPIGLLYLTVLLGPIALVRYVLYLFFTVPLILALLLDPGALGGRAVSTPCDG